MNVPRTIGAAALLACLAFAGTAQAHPKLLSTNPVANSAVAKPTKIALKFSETLIAPMSAADVIMTKMPGIAAKPMKMAGVTSAVEADRKTLVLTARKPQTTRTYRVNWHVVSADTHRIQGSFTFAVR